MLIRRRISIKFLLGLFVLFVFFLFFITLVQFNQIENPSEIRLKKIHSLDKLKSRTNEFNEKSMRIRKLKEKVDAKFPNRFNRYNDFSGVDEVENEIRAETISKTIKSMQKLVHLDLKGAPPKINYLKEIIPYFKKAGATGLLIEYEDFFPYSNDLEAIKNQNHYTNQELKQLFSLAKESQLTLIPLVQMYGHLEFVLKLKQFAYLREEKQHFQVITPCLNDTYEKVLFRMLDQVIDAHPDDIEYIHIGCDEVYHINENSACKPLEARLKTPQDFFLYHVSKIVDYIKKKRPNLQVIIWDDMIRKNLNKNDDLIKFSKKIIPMVWDYNEINKIPIKTWKSYDSFFKEIWIASAFKGATHQLELIPNAEKHYNNHLAWLNFILNFKNPQKLKGIALTGWSRYDHMQSVCETLPAAIPSLVLCLQTFINYDKEESFVFKNVKELTQCNYENSLTGFVLNPSDVARNPSLNQNISNFYNFYSCKFPGDQLYNWLLELKFLVEYFDYKHITYSNILNNYMLKNKFFNTMIYEISIKDFYPKLKDHLNLKLANGDTQFDKYFYGDLYEEIKNVYIIRFINIIETRLTELNKTAMPDSAFVRPFNKISQSII